MKATAKIIMAVAAGLLFTAYAQAAQDIPFSGFLGKPTQDGRKRCPVGYRMPPPTLARAAGSRATVWAQAF